MIKMFTSIGVSLVALSAANPANADVVEVVGKIVRTEGHRLPECRRVALRKADGTVLWFRIPDMGTENSMLAVALSAQGSGINASIAYDPALGTGCGTEPAIAYISMTSL